MFDEFDEALRNLLMQEIPIRGNEVEISFDQPRREWSARLNRPTLSLFLYDMRENLSLRNRTPRQNYEPARGEMLIQRPEVRMDLYYMITAWASEVDDEHRLLARTLLVLLRHGQLPANLMTGVLSEHTRAILLEVAQYEHRLNPTEIWGVLDNELRAGISLRATLTLNPYAPVFEPVVRTRELRLVDMDVRTVRQQRDAVNGTSTTEEAIFSQLFTIGGVVNVGADLSNAQLSLVELGRDVPIDAEGHFVIGNLRKGSYTLRLEIPGQEAITQTIEVPSARYDIARAG